MQDHDDDRKDDKNTGTKPKPKQYLTFDKALAMVRNKKIGGWTAAAFGATFTPWLFKCTDYPRLLFIPAIILCLLFLWFINGIVGYLEDQNPSDQPTPPATINQVVPNSDNYKEALAEIFAPRKLTESQKIKMMPAIKELGTQNFVVVQLGFGDNEAGNYAKQIAAFLRDDCRWTGTCYLSIVPSDTGVRSGPGIAVTLSPEDTMNVHKTKTVWPIPQQLWDIFKGANIAMSTSQINMYLKPDIPMPKGTAVILVGPKPRPEDYAPSPFSN